MNAYSSKLGEEVCLSNEEIAEMLLYGKSWYIICEEIIPRKYEDELFNTTNLWRELVPTNKDHYGRVAYAAPIVPICLWFKDLVVWKFNIGEIYAVKYQ